MNLDAVHARRLIAEVSQALNSGDEEGGLAGTRLKHTIFSGADRPLGNVAGDALWREERTASFRAAATSEGCEWITSADTSSD